MIPKKAIEEFKRKSSKRPRIRQEIKMPCGHIEVIHPEKKICQEDIDQIIRFGDIACQICIKNEK